MNKFVFLFTIVFFSCTAEEATDKTETPIDSVEVSVDRSEIEPEEQVSTTPGESIEYHPNGAVKMKGMLDENGERNGLWVSFYDNGTKWSESYYINGKRHGHSITFFPNGQIRYIGEYLNDEKTGSWKFYTEDGILQKEENF
jgi:antitoxin component YwqK of YwqJK toxin-antitoxin module